MLHEHTVYKDVLIFLITYIEIKTGSLRSSHLRKKICFDTYYAHILL